MFVLLVMPTFHKDNYYDDLHSFRTESLPHSCDWKDHRGKNVNSGFNHGGHTSHLQLILALDS